MREISAKSIATDLIDKPIQKPIAYRLTKKGKARQRRAVSQFAYR